MLKTKSIEKNRSTSNVDPIWHVQLTLFIALLLQLFLPDKFVAGPRFALPILEALLVLSLFLTTNKNLLKNTILRKINSVTLIVFIGIANIYALQRLAHILLIGGRVADGHGLILTAMNIFFTNVIVFGLLYWELDAGGPVMRKLANLRDRDFSFPQMQNPELAPIGWIPNFLDYLYVSLTNATAFSPTDTMPLTRIAKLLMGTQSLVSLAALALVASRAVNILK
jgi:hypothetical protein